MEQYIGTIGQVTGEGTWHENWVSWCSFTIISGSHMEDEYDIVYHYGIGKSPDFNQTPPQWFIDNVNGDERKAYTTITHFWDADYGPDKLSDLNDTAC